MHEVEVEVEVEVEGQAVTSSTNSLSSGCSSFLATQQASGKGLIQPLCHFRLNYDYHYFHKT